jgi:hypothetical protein
VGIAGLALIEARNRPGEERHCVVARNSNASFEGEVEAFNVAGYRATGF